MAEPRDVAAVREPELAAAATVVLRFRRRRALAGAAVAVGVAVAASSGSLLPTPRSALVPTREPATSAPPAGGRAPSTPTPEPPPPAGARPVGRAPAPGAPARPAASAAPAGVPAPRADTPQPPPARGPVRGAMARSRTREDTTCGLAISVRPEVCTSARAVPQKDGGYVLRFAACLRTPADVWSSSVRFTTTKEVDFVVTRTDGTPLWKWSAGQRFAKRSLTLAFARNGDCYEWRTRWSGRLDDGRRLARGTYRLVAAGRDSERLLRRVSAPLTR